MFTSFLFGKKMSIVWRFVFVISILFFCKSSVLADPSPELWSFKTGARIYASPVFQDNTVYIGSTDNLFYALNADDGSQKWAFDAEQPVHSTAVLHGDYILFEAGNILFCLDKQEGALQWEKRLCEGEPKHKLDEWDYFHSSPVVDKGIVYIGTEKGFIHGIDILTGESTLTLQTPSWVTIRATPAIENDKLYIGDWSGNMYCVDLLSQTFSWTFKSVGAIQSSPVIFNNTLYFGGRSTFVFAVDCETGEKVWSWREATGSWVCGSPIVCDSTVYFGGSDNHMVLGFNYKDGEQKITALLEHNIFTRQIITDDYIFAGSADCYSYNSDYTPGVGSLFVIDRQTSKAVNRFTVNGNIFSTPVLHDGVFYFGSENGHVYAVDKQLLINHPVSNTTLDTKTKTLGTMGADASPFGYEILLYNLGEANDSIMVAIDYLRTEPHEALTLDQTSFNLAAGDSHNVTLTVNPGLFEPGKYTFHFVVTSQNNVLERNLKKSLRLTIEEASQVKNNAHSPARFSLLQNYPNPFNMETVIEYSVPESAFISLDVFNAKGEWVKTLVNEKKSPGVYSMSWNGLDRLNNPVCSGLYFYRIQADNELIDTKRMVLLK